MTHAYFTKNQARRWRQLGLTALLAAGTTAVQAQLNYPAGNAINAAGTYTDLGTTGTAIATANTDDANSAEQLIGFPFAFNGATMDRFILNTNGFLKLGSAAGMTAPTVALYTATAQSNAGGTLLGTAANDVNLLSPFNFDLLAGTSAAEYRMATTGTAPNRVCTIQWKNVADKAIAGVAGGAVIGTQYANMSFQVKLYETTNIIEFVYGTVTPAAAANNNFKYAQCGIKGSSTANNQVLRFTKGSVTPWASATALAGPVTAGATGALNFRQAVAPDNGRTFQFAPQFANDAATSVIYSLGKIPTTNGPHAVSAYVRNVGTNNLTNVSVSLTVTGSNTFNDGKIVPILGAGDSALVTFAPYTPTTVGTNTVRVAVANDDFAGNNARTFTQQVTANVLSYADNSPISSGVGGAGQRLIVNKHTLTQPRTVSSVAVTLLNDASNVGRTVYGVVLNSAGGIVAQSAPVVLTQADLGLAKTFTMPTPPTIQPGAFYAGIAQTTQTGTADPYFPIAIQEERPTRISPDTAYLVMAITGGPGTPSRFGRFMVDVTLGAPTACAAPTGVTVTNPTGSGATVTFTGPANSTGYTIIYGPAGFNPASGGTTVTTTASPYSLTGLAATTTYQLYIRSNCGATDQSALVGPIDFTTTCTAPIISTFPYTENFDAAASTPCGVTILNVNNDTKTWRVTPTFTTPNGNVVPVSSSAPNAIIYEYNATAAADDWFFTPALFLRAGSRYQMSFKYRTFDAYPEKLEVKVGTAATPAGQTTTLWSDTNILNTTTGYVTTGVAGIPAVTPIQPTTTGNYYVGFHVFSAQDEYVLAVDDISISVVLGTSEALNKAISMFPNPSTGVVKLDVRGANAKNNLKVDVLNMLGQVVYSGNLKDNFENQLDLSNLAGGMYLLKVQTGSDFTTRQLHITK